MPECIFKGGNGQKSSDLLALMASIGAKIVLGDLHLYFGYFGHGQNRVIAIVGGLHTTV
jgi:hypothetical protein